MTENEPLEHAKENNIVSKKEKNASLDILMERYTQRFDGKYVNKIKNLELAFKVLFIVMASLLVTILLLVNTVISISDKKEIHLEVAKDIDSGTYVIGPDWASESYFTMFAKSIILDKTNFTFTNFSDKLNDMLQYTVPDTYVQSLADLKRDAEFVENNKITQTFTARDWTFSTIKSAKDKNKISKAKIIAKGILTRKVSGITTIDGKLYEFPINIVIENGMPYIETFKPVYADRGATKDKNERVKKSFKKKKEGETQE